MQQQIIELQQDKFKYFLLCFAKTVLYIVFPPCWLLAFFGSSLYGKVFKNGITSFFNRYILPPMAVIGLFFYVFSQNEIYPFGNKTIAWCDLTQQGVPYWMNFKSVLEGEENLFLNMGNASGLNGWSLLRGYFLYPLNYLAVLFDRTSMMEAVTLLSVFKLALCSVTAMVFFKITCKKLHPSLSVALSMMYSFCAFGLMYYQIINWPDMMYILPLYFAGVYRLIKKGKIAMYAITLAFVLNNFSFGFMTVMATILFFGYYTVSNKSKERNAENTKNVIVHFVTGSLFAALLCAHSWLPFFSSYGSSARSVELSESLALEPFFTSKNTIYPILMSTAFIFVAVFSFKRYVKTPIEKACMFLFGVMLIPVVIEPINAMWHGGSYMSFPGRYLFIATFLGLAIGGALLSREKTADNELQASIATENNRHTVLFFSIYAITLLLFLINEVVQIILNGLDFSQLSADFLLNCIFISFAIIGYTFAKTEREKASFTVKLCKNLCSIYILYGVISHVIKATLSFIEGNINDLDHYATTLWGNSTSYSHVLVIFILFLFVYCLCYGFYRWRFISKHVLALALVVVMGFEAFAAINVYMVPPINKVKTDNFRAYADLTERIDDDEFYRVKNEKFLNATYSVSEANFPGAIGYNSMGHYSSLASETYLYFAKALGYSSMWMKIESFGGTKFSDALMCVKYGIDKSSSKTEAIYENDLYQIAEKEFYLPLGLFTNDTDFEIDVTDIARIDLQERIFDSLTGGKYDLFEAFEPTATNCAYKDRAETSDGRFYINPTKSGSSKLTYKIEVEGTKTLYFDCFDEFSNELSEKIYDSFSITVNGKKIKSKYPVNTANGILELGTFKDETVTVTLGVLENVQCRSFGVFAMDDELLEKSLSEISTANLVVDGNDIIGSYDAAEDGFVIVSVSDINGYSCKVNGEKVKISRAYGGLIGIPVSAGANNIELSYTPPLVYPAIAIVVIGIALGIIVLLIMKKKKYDTVYDGFEAIMGEKALNVLCIIGKICAIIAMIAVIIGLYIYPMLIKLDSYLQLTNK